ncbi:retinal pigment epithelial membrane family protein [Emericellopsis cladophorae]|uniref:Retinal pigment epithelial membrane family protein n=1 Tax=Emericellopsis cladophorae TaxID=2686198 RepID=A0A9Q0BB13_9HYPO|nr:retinal pigment epithelial membrane family protein [Emericellopsis cladophorae]KAI6778191.1 retinal pigment epithelial membrane family protein [Emericellopsis cladophorae]
MAGAINVEAKARYNTYFVPEEDLIYLLPYLRDVPETPEEIECVTNGTWPPWLDGSFVRVGAGRFTVPLSEDSSKPRAVLQHFFDGLAILHKFRMVEGRVYYRSRHTAEGLVRKAKREGYLSTTMFGLNANTPLKDAQDPCSALLGAQVLVHTDFNMLQACDATTLEPKRMLTYAQIDPQLEGYGICAHPPKDRKRGLTFNYLISPDQPIHIDVSDTTRTFADMLQFEPNTPTQFFVLDKLTGKHIATYEQKDGFMFFHSVNAYDYLDSVTGHINVHVDLCSYEDEYITYHEYSLNNIVDPAGPYQNGTLTRYELAAVNTMDLSRCINGS